MFLERYYPEFFEGVRKRVIILILLILAAFSLISFRLWYLQIMKGDYFKTLSKNNRIRIKTLPSYRGKIYDRNREVLVSLRSSFNLYIVPEDAKNLDKTLEILNTKLDINVEKLKETIKSSPAFHPIIIKRNIRRDKVAFIEEHKMELLGVVIEVEPLRSYKNKDLAAHVLGYISEVNKRELKKLEGQKEYKLGDFIGKYGIEKVYEKNLQGKKGVKHIEVDAAGRELNVMKVTNPNPGHSIILTIDAKLQKVAERLLNKKKRTGSIVAMSPKSGEILAMVSNPSFDPNLFSTGISSKNWKKLISDEWHPLQNRSIQGQFPPGSTYKIVTAAAGLEEGVINEDTTFSCPGYFKHGRRSYRCWKKSGHGKITVKKALIGSCDVFFYKLGIKLGIDTIAKYANMFGLGQLTSINMLGEKPGLVPTKAWKQKARGESWLSGETVSASVGQGYNLVTPLQQVNMISAVANGGNLWKPTLVIKIEDIDGKVISENPPEILHKIKLKVENLNIIKEALLGVVNSKGGTAWRARMKDIKVAGKTGTAQVIRMKENEKSEDQLKMPIKHRDHAWFVSFAPFDDPEIAIAVIVEHGGHGGAAAAPIAKEMIKFYMQQKNNTKKKKVKKDV